MSIYKISFKQLQQQPHISEMLTALEKGLNKYNIDFYLVGAVARDVWMTAINDIPPSRVTGDIDFAVFINDKNTYADLRDYLINVEGFIPYKGNGFVLKWKNIIQVDLMPFGEIEAKPSNIIVEGTGLTSLNMPGFKEIYDSGLPEAELEEKHRFKFCTLPGIVLLKLIAFQERPEIRRDDIKDISKILKHFFDMYADEIYENHNDLFGDKDINLHWIAARVLGRDMGKIALLNEELFLRIKKILKKNTVDIHSSDIAKIMAEFFQNTIEENVKLLEQVKIGYLENQ
jgi:predicted nucleotidyltransferase